MKRRRVVAIFVEPTPYIGHLIRELREQWGDTIEVRYLGRDMSQVWGEDCLEPGRQVTLPELWKTLRALSPGDIVHLCGWGHPTLLAALTISKLHRLRIFVESDSTLSAPNSPLNRAAKSLAYPLLFQFPDHFLPGGRRQSEYLQKYGVSANRMTMTQMTVDVAGMMTFARERGAALRQETRHLLALAQDSAAILFVGRLEPHKGVSDLLAAFDMVSKSCPSARFVVVGDGTLAPQVSDAATRNPSITYCGRLSGEALWARYLAADIFVLPSHFEPWGLVVNEAMAFGLPVVISDAAGCGADLMPEGREGQVFPAGNVERLAQAITRFVSDHAARQASAEAASRRIAPWSLANEARNIISAWERYA